MLRSTSLLYLLVLLFNCASAFPWTSHDNNQLASHQHHSSRLRSVFPQLTWLRDTAIEKIYGVPNKTDALRKKDPKQVHIASTQLPATLLAKYGGDVVLRFNLTTAAEELALAQAADTLFLDVWEFTNNWADIRLREDDVSSLLGLLPPSLQGAYSHLMPDLAKSIYESYPSSIYDKIESPRLSSTHDEREPFSLAVKINEAPDLDNIFFREYQPLSVIVPWMRLMASMFTTHVKMLNIGTSYEGRDIPALKVGVSPRNVQEPVGPRKTIIITGGSHAREWISVSTVNYVAWSLITSYGKNPGITKLLEEFDFVFIPTINVDGYVYTWENDRLWRKNRQQTNLRFCKGLDLDRSFGFEWDGLTFQNNPCSESFPGEEPFQAVESHRLAEWAKNETENNGVHFVGFLDLHSYSQQILYPYSYSCAAYPPSQENLEELGMGIAKAIRIYSGEQYSVNSACEGAVAFRNQQKGSSQSRMETGGGSAIDWFYHELKVRYSYQIKLRDMGSYGFLLPKENIVPTGEEVFNAVKYFGDFLLGNKGIESAPVSVLDEDLAFASKGTGGNGIENSQEDDVEIAENWDEHDWELRRRRR